MTCWNCGSSKVRATLDSGARPNTIELIRDATERTRARTIERVAQIIEGIKVKGVEDGSLKMLADYVRQQVDKPSTANVGDAGGDLN